MAYIKKRGDSYTIRVCLGYDSNGKRQNVSKTWKPECKMTPNTILHLKNRQNPISASDAFNGIT